MNDPKAKPYPWTSMTLPASFSLRQYAPRPRGQGFGACEEYAAWGAVQCGRRVFDLQCPSLSVTYMPYKAMQTSLDNPGVWNLPPYLAGAIYRDFGICRSDLHDRIWEAPSPVADADAATRKGLENYSLKRPWIWGVDPLDFREPLLNGLPVLCTFPIWESFMAVGHDGRIPMPNASTEGSLGGHAVYFIGYDDNERRLLGQNNWDENWGDKSFFTLPYEYIRTYMGGGNSAWCFTSTTQAPPVPMPPTTNASIIAAMTTALNAWRAGMVTQTQIDQLKTLVGQLTPDTPVTPGTGTNVCLGASAVASSSYSASFPATAVTNGDRAGRGWGSPSGGWNSVGLPAWIEVVLPAPKTISSVTVYTVQDAFDNPIEPTDSLMFSKFGVVDFTIECSGTFAGSVTGNSLVKRTVTFAPVTTDRIRITVTRSADRMARIVEIEAT